MANVLTAITDGWRALTRARPGQRFRQYYRRSQRQRSLGRTVLRIALGVSLTAAGVVLWVLPGPGWLLVMCGMALFASESRWLAKSLDRLEVLLRAAAQRWRSRRRGASHAR